MDIEDIKKKKLILIEQFFKERKLYRLKLFNYLDEIYQLSIKINDRYTLRDMAYELKLSENIIYKIMAYKKTTPYIRKLIEDDKISFDKVVKIMQRITDVSDNEKNALIDNIIKNKLTSIEVDKYIHDKKLIIEEVEKVRDTKHMWNISRDINAYCARLLRCLIAIDNLPKNQKMIVKKNLILLKKQIEKSVVKIK